ncbi:glycoside hydrolase domain-containing protein [Arenibacter sp. S6351L]|uniref:DUF4091 domain-containing protein n=1 Tax=Arenibacter sp. S6351L TaxID=2926407 RepID=UPI001FF12576|nr:glycoside hydrolase domain-containing protein [Arenibacter sp. S6351L]MCK0136025.1 DUF4091 domain-containing protein [Arenibacter sp. S6351L]
MKTYNLIILSGIFLIVGCKHISNTDLVFEYVDPLQKIFPESTYFPPSTAHADVARGEHATFQFAVRSNETITNLKIEVSPPEKEGESLIEIKKGFVGFVEVGRTNPEPSRDSYKPLSGFFPDPIIYQETKDVAFGTTQPIWVSIKIPKSASPGIYTGEVQISGEINGNTFVKIKEVSVEVFKPIIGKTSLWVTNWFFLDRLHYLNNNKPVEKYSDLFWQLSRVLAKTLAEYRQNVAMLSPLDHTEFTFENNKWSFNFSNFNKMVNLFIDEGVIGRLEGGHFGARLNGDWSGPFGLNVPVVVGDSIDKQLLPLNDRKVQTFYSSFLPALMNNLKDNGWEDIYLQHIADEPIDDNVDSYIEISKFIKGLVQDVKIIEACHTHKLENMIDVWVPQMNFLKEGLEFYNDQQKKGSEAWYYTCLAPKGEYANRFIEQPLIKTRLLHWVNYKYDIPGYLHWGFNFWGSGSGISTSNDPYGDTSGMIVSSGNVLPGGDCWIVYPGDKRIFPSIRLEAMRDGIVDYELLKMYHEKFPDKANDLVGTTVYGFEHYDTNIGELRRKRREILENLSN